MISQVALIGTIFFHKGDRIPEYQFTHYPCAIEPVYIYGLDANNAYAQSDDLFLFEDRIIFHLHPSVTRFEIKSKIDDHLIEIKHIRWKLDCIEEYNNAPSTSNVSVNQGQKNTSKQNVSTKKIETTTKLETPTKVELPSIESQGMTMTTAIITTKKEAPSMAKKQLVIEGVKKQTIYQHASYDLLSKVYLYDETRKDYSHLLVHSPFSSKELGIYFIEIEGNVGDSKVYALMEVEVIQKESIQNSELQKPLQQRTVFITFCLMALGGMYVIWDNLKK